MLSIRIYYFSVLICVLLGYTLYEVIILQIGKNLKKIRKQKELTQIQLAEISGISRNALINYENDKRIPSIDTLSKLAKALKIEKTIFYFDIENEVMTNEDVLYFYSLYSQKNTILLMNF